jgi:type IV pilus assembly protein PilA
MMARIRKAMEEKDQGFTLIELLVVMIIIGILAAIAIPVFLNQRQKAVDSSIKADLRSVANNLETYQVDNQAYPAAGEVTQSAAGAAVQAGTAAKGGASVSVSNGNVVVYGLTTAAGGYCIGGYNANASANAATKAFWYVSNGGGLQAGAAGGKPAACA